MMRQDNKPISSYDVLKLFGLITMIVDHLGFFFWPDLIWLRVIGRFSAPVWFFLIGYARTREVPWTIWAGGVFMTLAQAAAGRPVFPLDVLFTLAFCRLTIDWAMACSLRERQSFWGFFLFLFFLILPGIIVVEYGSLGLMFAMLGYMRRHKDNPEMPHSLRLAAFIAIISATYIVMNTVLLGHISTSQELALIAGIAALDVLLLLFRPLTFPRLTRYMGPVSPILRLLGRRTLEVYLLHMLVFTGIAIALFPEHFPFMRLRLLPPVVARFLL